MGADVCTSLSELGAADSRGSDEDGSPPAVIVLQRRMGPAALQRALAQAAAPGGGGGGHAGPGAAPPPPWWRVLAASSPPPLVFSEAAEEGEGVLTTMRLWRVDGRPTPAEAMVAWAAALTRCQLHTCGGFRGARLSGACQRDVPAAHRCAGCGDPHHPPRPFKGARQD